MLDIDFNSDTTASYNYKSISRQYISSKITWKHSNSDNENREVHEDEWDTNINIAKTNTSRLM